MTGRAVLAAMEPTRLASDEQQIHDLVTRLDGAAMEPTRLASDEMAGVRLPSQLLEGRNGADAVGVGRARRDPAHQG